MSQRTETLIAATRLAGTRAWTDEDLDRLSGSLARHCARDRDRYNLQFISIDRGHAIATNGQRMMFAANVVDEHETRFVAAADGGRITLSKAPEIVFPDVSFVVNEVLRPGGKKFSFSWPQGVRAPMCTTPASLTQNGIVLGGCSERLATVDLRLLAGLPNEKLTLTIWSEVDPMLVQPVLGGWFSTIMPYRLDRKNEWFAPLAEGGAQ